MSADLTNSAVAIGLERVVFVPVPNWAVPKNVQTTVQLLSLHMLVRLCSKPFWLGFSSMRTEDFQVYKLGLEKAEKSEVKLPNIC